MSYLSIEDTESRLDMLFQPDELAADQYQNTFKRGKPIEPEKLLMLAVLEDAIMCFQRYLHSRHPKEQRLYEDAASWIFDKVDIRAFSFESICDACGLDAGYLRMGLLRWREQKNARVLRNKVPEVSPNAMRPWGMRGQKG